MLAHYDQIPRDARPAVLSAMATVATQNGQQDLKPVTRELIESAGIHLFDLAPADVRLDPIAPADLANVLPDEPSRELAIELLSLIPFADKELTEAEISVVHEFADGVDARPMIVVDLERLEDHNYRRLVFDYARRGFGEIAGKESFWSMLRITLHELREQTGDKRTAAKYRELESLPEGSLGKVFFDFYRGRGFAFPGEKHSLGELLTKHDAMHILSGNNTDAVGEINVSATTAGMIPGHKGLGTEFIMETLLLFQDNTVIAPSAQKAFLVGSREDALDPDALMLNLRRGMDMKVDVFSPAWDFWSSVEQPLEQVRDAVGLTEVHVIELPVPAGQGPQPSE